MDKGRSTEETAILKDIHTRLLTFLKIRGNLIPILQMIQERHGYLSAESIGLVAVHLDISVSEIYGVATFYNQFRFHPPGKHPIKVCLGTACHIKGGDIVLENFERRLGIREGETTSNREFSIERVACVGCCAIAPVTIIDNAVYGHMAPSKVEGLYLRIQVETEMEERKKLKNVPSN